MTIKEIVLFLTQNCNMKCSYCFVMFTSPMLFREPSVSNVDNFISFLQNNINDFSTNLRITIVGGEPFTNINILLYLLDSLDSFTKTYNFNIEVVILTNGTIYSDKIKDYKHLIKFIQISLDSYKFYNNLTRRMKNKCSDVYDLILDNASKFCNDGIRIAFHGVLDTKNISYTTRYIDKIIYDIIEIKKICPEFIDYEFNILNKKLFSIPFLIMYMMFLMKINKISNKYEGVNIYHPKYFSPVYNNDNLVCSAGVNIISVDLPNEIVHGCYLDCNTYNNIICKFDENIYRNDIINFLNRKMIINIESYVLSHPFGHIKISDKLIKFFSHIGLKVCWKENEIFSGDKFVIPFHRVIISLINYLFDTYFYVLNKRDINLKKKRIKKE